MLLKIEGKHFFRKLTQKIIEKTVKSVMIF